MGILCIIAGVLFIGCLLVPFWDDLSEQRKRIECRQDAHLRELVIQSYWIKEYMRSVKYAAPYQYQQYCYKQAKLDQDSVLVITEEGYKWISEL